MVSDTRTSVVAARGGACRRFLAMGVVVALAALASTLGGMRTAHAATLQGIDVSSYQGSINWTAVHNSGKAFAYIKATEGTYHVDSAFGSYYPNAYYAGLVRGAYHFGIPNNSSGAAQADYFLAHGGRWSADNQTLPGALDIEWNPYSGGTCYGLSQAGMRGWINDFLNEYHAKTTRWAVIYTPPAWWNQCTGSWTAPASNDPLWVVNVNGSPNPLPAGWGFYTFWQYGQGGVSGISGSVDLDQFNGDATRLRALANNTP
jgi:GH25 family lysozyme M1 (1,4-beta-N-acetylmuramidase)